MTELNPRKSPLKRSANTGLPLESVMDDSENLDASQPVCVEIGIQADSVTTHDVGCQTDVICNHEPLDSDYILDHSYTFHIDSGEMEVEKLQKEIEKLSTQIHDLEDQLNEFKVNRFSLSKIKDDPKAMLFYTGFINYSVFESMLKYLSPKAEQLRYWRGKSENFGSKNNTRQNEKLRPARKLLIEEEYFMILVRIKVGLFVRDIAERFGISQSQFSKIFTTWIIFLFLELPMLFPFPSQELVRKKLFCALSFNENYFSLYRDIC